MASTPSNNRLKLTPSNSPFLQRPSRSPIRARGPGCDVSRLSLKRVVGTTCASPTGFDTVQSSFAYIAGGAVVVVDVHRQRYSQRFYRARPTAVPVFAVSPVPNAPSTPNATPKANDSRNRVTPSLRDSFYADGPDSPSSRTWTSRERIKAATCLSLSRDGRYLAVGETGYAPRVLIFNLQDSSSDTPLVSISEHTFGVNAVAWSHDTRYLASLGAANDGFLYLWKIEPRTGAAKLFQQNRCTSFVRGMIWIGASLLTLGVRHVKVWRVEEGHQSTSPTKHRFLADGSAAAQPPQKTLPGRNILLGSLIEATFSCAAAIDGNRAIICSEAGDVCLLDDTTGRQMKLARVLNLGFTIDCITIRGQLAYASGKGGQFATLSVERIVDGRLDAVLQTTQPANGLLALGFLDDKLVTIDAKRSIDVWDSKHIPGQSSPASPHIPIPGHGDPIVGIQPLPRPNDPGAAFYTWSGSGKVKLWNLDGTIRSSFSVDTDQVPVDTDGEVMNHLSVVRATKGGKMFVAGDRLGILRVIDFATKDCLMETRAHSSECHGVTIYEDGPKMLMASCGRDRTAQLFSRTSDGVFEHFQTLEFAAKVVQVLFTSDEKVLTCSMDRTLQLHDLISKDGEPDVMAAIPLRTLSLKASPTSMTLAPDEKSVFVSLLDRSTCHYELATGQLLNSFKCTDENGVESVALDSLTFGQTVTNEPTFLLGISNTDKSVRLYDAQTGSFLDREWGHTEAINGVTLIDEEEEDEEEGAGGSGRRVVSVGSDGTIMIWSLDLQDPVAGSMSRDPSPAKDASRSTNRPPLRRVLSKAELAEFQRPSPTASGRRSPPRILNRRSSRYNLAGSSSSSSSSTLRTPNSSLQVGPSTTIVEDTPSRRASAGSPRDSPPPPVSPRGSGTGSIGRGMTRRPSLPALSTTPPNRLAARKKTSATNLRGSYGFGSLNMATEQACRTLRAYRKKLNGPDPIGQDVIAELDQELRLTAAALGDRAIRSKAASDVLLNGLLDQYSDRLVTLLDEKLRLRDRSTTSADGDGGGGGAGGKEGGDSANPSADEEQDRPRSPGEGSSSGSAS